MTEQQHEGTTDGGEPYVIYRSGSTITAQIGLGEAPSTYTCDSEAEAAELFDEIVKEVSRS